MLSRAARRITSSARPFHASAAFSSASAHDDVLGKAEAVEADYLVKTYNSDGVRTKKGLIFTHGKGPYLYDAQGHEYLDFCSGIAVNNLGHADEEWAAAIADQATKVCHVSNLFHSEPPLKLAKKLVNNSTFDKVFFCNSGGLFMNTHTHIAAGTEANEAAYKFARLHGSQVAKGTPIEGKKNHVIAFKGGFHGRSSGSLSLTYKPAIREPFLPLVPDITFAEYNNLDDVKAQISDRTCAIIVEPIQGEGGVMPAKADFLRGLRALCDAHGALLICDEVQTGLGRTGKLFGHEVYDVQPDLITLAKPLAGGLPIGAVLTKNHVADAVTPGSHGTTFGGNPIVCAAANVVMDRLTEPSFLLNVQKLGRLMAEGLKGLQAKHPTKIKEVRLPIGEAGLYAGVECFEPVGSIVKDLVTKGVIVITAGEKILRLCPPLVISEKDVATFIQALDQSLAAHTS
ncbi:acetylornithine aminotransferase, mitochondrial precursor [Achlya hypogyna]|uniref:acetylornithine transaminase n=1 Tax=Achlya hypogyna TaxID=1202772 RepID=A0A1V9Z515_ACHHY|nr:acetylornithine aminotransferase, mitochondrial precursor [Achlya hypogyna]